MLTSAAMSSLVICEKPSVAQDVAKALLGSKGKRVGDHWEGPDAIVAFAVGHLVEQVDPDAYDGKYKKWKYEDLPILPDHFKYQARDARANKTLKNVQGAWVQDMKVKVDKGKIAEYRVNMKVTFVLKK